MKMREEAVTISPGHLDVEVGDCSVREFYINVKICDFIFTLRFLMKISKAKMMKISKDFT